MRQVIFILLFLVGFSSCNKLTKLSNIPKIKFNSFSSNAIKAGSDSTLSIFIGFEDGDGNIGFGTPNLFLRDSRDTIFTPFSIPTIGSQYNPKDGLKGVFEILYPAAFLLTRSDSIHSKTDTLYWDIYMIDEAGNHSDTVQSTDLILYN